MGSKTEVVRMKGAQVVSVDKKLGIVTVVHHGEPYAVEVQSPEMEEAWPKMGAVGVLERRWNSSSQRFTFDAFRSRYKTVEEFFEKHPNSRNEIEWVDEVVEEDLGDGD